MIRPCCTLLKDDGSPCRCRWSADPMPDHKALAALWAGTSVTRRRKGPEVYERERVDALDAITKRGER